MEHAKKIANLAKNFAAKFPDLDEFYLYIHLLGYVSGFDKTYFFSHSDIAPIHSLINFDKKIIREIEESLPFSIKQLSEKEKKKICKYLLDICLQFERQIETTPNNHIDFLDDLLRIEPQAVSQNNGWYNVDFSALSPKAQKQYIDWEIKRYFHYKVPAIPQNLAEKLAALATPGNGQTIYDPNCNIGSIFVELYKKFPDLDFSFRGIVRNQYEWLFCIVNLYVNGLLDDKRADVEIEVSSPFEDIAQKYYEMKSGDISLRGEFADIAVSVVPFTEESSEDELDSRFYALSYSLKKPAYSYIELMLNAVRDTGKAIAIVPDVVLYSSEGRFFREAYLSRDWIESVISLPENSFTQTVLSESSIVVFNKNKAEKGIVFFDGEGSEFEKTEVKNSTVLSESDADLRAARYALKEIKDIRNTIKMRRERRTANPAYALSKEIGLHQYFDNLAATLPAKFPTIENTVYLYLLVVVMMILDRGNQWLLAHNSFLINSRIYKEIEDIIYEDYYNRIIGIVLDDLVNRGSFTDIKTEDLIIGKYGIQTESAFKGAFRKLCSYLINRCLQIESGVKVRDVESLWKEIAKREPKAIQLERQAKARNFEDLLEEIKSSEFRHVQIGGYHSLINFSELTDSSYQELSEAFIAQSFSFERNYLQCFHGLDETLAKIASPKPGQEIFNPNCGIGSLFVELQKQFPNHDLRFTGRVDDSFFYILCEANLLAHNVKAFINQEETLDGDLEITFFGENPDIAIGITPLKIELLGKRDKKFFPFSYKMKKVEYSFIELMINSLNETGKAVVVVPEEFLYRWHAKGFKKEYLKNDWVESVISLPREVFKEYGSFKTSIVVFNKNKTEKGFITFKSEDAQSEETKVSLDEVLGKLDLRVSRYALKEAEELKDILADSPHPVVKIRDIIQDSFSGKNYSPDNRIVENSAEILPYVRVQDLSNNDKEFTLDVSKVERKISIEKADKRTVINFPAVLVSKIAPKLKPTYFKFTDQPIVVGSDIIALKMKDDVNIEYFLTQLHSRLVQIQVEMMSSGTTINRINKEDFLNTQIILPPLTEQRLQVFEMIADIEEKAIAQEAVAKAKRQTNAIEYEVIANMNHSLKNKLGVIINDYDTLIRFLQRKERTNSPVSFDDTIRPVFEGENSADVDTIRGITERLKSNLLDTSKVFNTSLRLQTRELKKNAVELIGYFRNEVKASYAGENFTIEVVAEPKLKLNVLLDRAVFKEAIDNLINNAEMHGFADKNRRYQIVFELSKLREVYDEESATVRGYARIVYKNDGKPFPKGFSFIDYVRYSSKAGKTQGTGIGGAVIDRIIKLHEGKFSELPVGELSLFPVQFEILLPLDE